LGEAFRLAFAHLVAIAFWAISFRRSGVILAARFFAIATAPGSFFFARFVAIATPFRYYRKYPLSCYRKNGN
jgi:hypothetical protein